MERELLLNLLAVAVNRETPVPELPPALNWKRLLDLARRHRVETLLYAALKQMGAEPPAEIKKALSRDNDRALFLDAQRDHAAAAVSQALCQARIPYIPLKGQLLKHDYPAPHLRTMTDLDILVRLDDYPAINKAISPLGERCVSGDGSNYSFTLPPQIHIELHPVLISPLSRLGAYLNPGWQYMDESSGPYACRLSEEGFYLHLMFHLASHFAGGGTGIRSVLDIWVYRHNHQPQPEWDFIYAELDKAGLLRFARNIEALAEAWFSRSPLPQADKPLAQPLAEMADYIISSGVYGLASRAVLNEASFDPRGKGWAVLMRRAFYPRAEMENRYPWLRGRIWLMPVAWCCRAVRAVTIHSKEIAAFSREAGAIRDEDVADQQARLQRFGFELGR